MSKDSQQTAKKSGHSLHNNNHDACLLLLLSFRCCVDKSWLCRQVMADPLLFLDDDDDNCVDFILFFLYVDIFTTSCLNS